jgi:anaerobic selenocysteine-containing dehydrogenase
MVRAQVEVTEEIMRGVVSLPHGWGHDADGAGLSVAAAHAGTNSNVLSDETEIDAVSGNAVLNGIPVALGPVREGAQYLRAAQSTAQPA